MKDGENFVRRAAFLELGGDGMANKILFCALFVGIQRTIEDHSEIGWRSGGGEVRVRHDGGTSKSLGGICSYGGEDDSIYLGESGGREEECTGHSPAAALPLPCVHACIPRSVRLLGTFDNNHCSYSQPRDQTL